MDENSCENEIKENVDDQKERKTKGDPEIKDFGAPALTGKASRHQVSNRCGSSVDASVSGPSTNCTSLAPKYNDAEPGVAEGAPQKPIEVRTRKQIEPSPPIHERLETARRAATVTPTDLGNSEPRVRAFPLTQELLTTKRGSVGPPPSYSFVMKQKKKMKRVPSPDILLTNRPPPPNYSGTRGLYITSEDRTIGFPSFAEPIWRSHSQPALCPRCGIIVLTTAHSHESIATHVAALALCLFGCWPCCLLPYCMNVCKNTFHYCPICQTFLGLYTPW